MTSAVLGTKHVVLSLEDGSRLILPWPLPDPLPLMNDHQRAEVDAWLLSGAPVTDARLTERRDSAAVDIDAQAEQARQLWITPGAGQAAVYLRKADEAEAVLALQSPDPADFPLLSAEIGVTADTLIGVAQVVKAQADAWVQVAGQIEALRLAAKADVSIAEDIEAIESIMASIVWPEPPE